MRVGELVVAIGSPLDMTTSASFGMIGHKSREAEEIGLKKSASTFIQSDAFITVRILFILVNGYI